METINPNKYKNIVFFTGAGMSAESGVPTYRGSGGIWNEYNWQEYACQKAFDNDPEKVLKFHELRRQAVLKCKPHKGHFIISDLEKQYSNISIITQNIDGIHQFAGNKNVTELHGSLWRIRCVKHGISEDIGEKYKTCKCSICDNWLRPDITWFEDSLDQEVITNAINKISNCDLFISIGTSGVVWPAAGFPKIAKDKGAYCVEINPETTEMSAMYDKVINDTASNALKSLFES